MFEIQRSLKRETHLREINLCENANGATILFKLTVLDVPELRILAVHLASEGKNSSEIN